MVNSNLSRNQRLAAVYFALVPALVVLLVLVAYHRPTTAILFGIFVIVLYTGFVLIAKKSDKETDDDN